MKVCAGSRLRRPSQRSTITKSSISRASNRGHLLTYTSAAVNLNHFRLLRVVGKGAFGKVRIVERKDTGLTFALKYAYPMFIPGKVLTLDPKDT